jgi:hypothetical protein
MLCGLGRGGEVGVHPAATNRERRGVLGGPFKGRL